MNLSSTAQQFSIGQQEVWVHLPDGNEIKAIYDDAKSENANAACPYWAKVWPSALAISRFLVENTYLIEGKNILELAAGLGLPAMFAAKFAKKVLVSDYLPEAILFIKQSIIKNEAINAEAILINWQNLPDNIYFDTLLLSDINYNPADFDLLYSLLLSQIKQGKQIILATPQRFSAIPFINKILPFCKEKYVMEIAENGKVETISILVM